MIGNNTEILMAQGFQDLSGQVLKSVVADSEYLYFFFQAPIEPIQHQQFLLSLPLSAFCDPSFPAVASLMPQKHCLCTTFISIGLGELWVTASLARLVYYWCGHFLGRYVFSAIDPLVIPIAHR
jgi:hypothetical protein